jgi:hypothetical protein
MFKTLRGIFGIVHPRNIYSGGEPFANFNIGSPDGLIEVIILVIMLEFVKNFYPGKKLRRILCGCALLYCLNGILIRLCLCGIKQVR